MNERKIDLKNLDSLLFGWSDNSLIASVTDWIQWFNDQIEWDLLKINWIDVDLSTSFLSNKAET